MKRVVVALFAGVAFGIVASAQQARPAPAQAAATPQFKTSVDIVHLDVSVLDKERNPIRGLTAKDFTVLEDGKPQQVAVFSAVNIPDTPPPSAPWIRDIAPDVTSNTDIKDRRLFLLAIDDAHFRGDLWAKKKLKDIALSVVDHLGPSDLAAVIYTQNNAASQDFTGDRAKLLAAVERMLLDPGGLPGTLSDLYSVGVLQRAVEALAEAPDRRKAIFYIGTGVAFSVAQLAAPIRAGTGGGLASMTARDIKDRMTLLFGDAKFANVNVYPLDACGLRVQGSGCAPSFYIQDYLSTLASQTGGRAVINSNDFAANLTDIFRENASYYMLGFQSTNAAKDGTLRRLEVTVNRPDADVRTRTGYYAPKAGDKEDIARRDKPLEASVSGVLPKLDLPMQVVAAPFAVAGHREAGVAIAVGVRQPIRQADDRTVQKTNLQVSAYNTDGKEFGKSTSGADVTLRAGASGQAEYELHARLDLKPGRYQLRVGAEIPSLTTTGSVYYDVVVPDFEKDALSLSGIAVSASSGAPIATGDVLKNLIPVAPTTRREFARTDRVTAFARAYQGGKLPAVGTTVRYQIRNEKDAVVSDRTQQIAAGEFASSKSADLRFDVPIAQLPAGAYVLTIEATAGDATARRDVRFRVIR